MDVWSMAGFTGAAIGTVMVHLHVLPPYHFLCITALARPDPGFILRQTQSTGTATRNEKQPIFARPDKSILNFGLIAFFSMICEGAMFDWSGIYFAKVVRPDPTLVTVGYTAFMCTMATGRFVGDWVHYRLGMKTMLQFSGLLTAGGLLLAVFFPHFITATIGFSDRGCRSFFHYSHDLQCSRKIKNHVAGCGHRSSFHHWLPGIFIWAAIYRIYSPGNQSAYFLWTNCSYGNNDCRDCRNESYGLRRNFPMTQLLISSYKQPPFNEIISSITLTVSFR